MIFIFYFMIIFVIYSISVFIFWYMGFFIFIFYVSYVYWCVFIIIFIGDIIFKFFIFWWGVIIWIFFIYKLRIWDVYFFFVWCVMLFGLLNLLVNFLFLINGFLCVLIKKFLIFWSLLLLNVGFGFKIFDLLVIIFFIWLVICFDLIIIGDIFDGMLFLLMIVLFEVV